MAVVFGRLGQWRTVVQGLQINPGWQLGIFVLGLAAGRGLLGELAPFAAPIAAIGALFFHPSSCILLLAGMLIGLAVRPPVYQGLPSLIDILLVAIIFFIARRYQKQLTDSWVAVALFVGGMNLIIKFCLMAISGAQPGFLPALFSESALAAALAVPFYYILRAYPQQKKFFFILLLILVYYGLGDLGLGPTNIMEVLARSVLLVVASGWGCGWGAAAGVILGLFSGSLITAMPRTGFYAATGLFSGLLSSWGSAGVILGFLLSSLFFSASYGQLDDLLGHLLASAIAVGLYLVSWRFLPDISSREKRESSDVQPLYAVVGVAQRSRPLEALCGDSFSVSRLEQRRLLLTISDGMGTGINAARESRIVVKLVEQLLGSGVKPEAAAGVVNTALFLRGGEESAATIDSAIAHLDAGSLEFLKVGAPLSFLKRGKAVEQIRSICWPAGILDEIDTTVLVREIKPGDILIMASDGVTEANQYEDAPADWLYTYLRDLPLEDAQVIADLVLKYALKIAGYENKDDMTVMVARFCREEEVE